MTVSEVRDSAARRAHGALSRRRVHGGLSRPKIKIEVVVRTAWWTKVASVLAGAAKTGISEMARSSSTPWTRRSASAPGSADGRRSLDWFPAILRRIRGDKSNTCDG